MLRVQGGAQGVLRAPCSSLGRLRAPRAARCAEGVLRVEGGAHGVLRAARASDGVLRAPRACPEGVLRVEDVRHACPEPCPNSGPQVRVCGAGGGECVPDGAGCALTPEAGA